QLVRVERVGGPRCARVAPAERAEPDRRDPDAVVEELEELGGVLRGDLDVLDDLLGFGPLAEPVQAPADLEAAVDGEQPPVDVRTQVAARDEAADAWVLHAERARAPEPAGVPAAAVGAAGERVFARALDRLVVDVLAGVVGRARGDIRKRAEREVQLVAAEDRSVDEVGPLRWK